jgi:hypothetical protein
LAEHQGNIQSDEDRSEGLAQTVNLRALDDLLNEERDESKKSKGRISALENNSADVDDDLDLQQTVLSLAGDVTSIGHPFPKTWPFCMNDEMIGNDRLHQELEDEKEEVGSTEKKPCQEIPRKRRIFCWMCMTTSLSTR